MSQLASPLLPKNRGCTNWQVRITTRSAPSWRFRFKLVIRRSTNPVTLLPSSSTLKHARGLTHVLSNLEKPRFPCVFEPLFLKIWQFGENLYSTGMHKACENRRVTIQLILQSTVERFYQKLQKIPGHEDIKVGQGLAWNRSVNKTPRQQNVCSLDLLHGETCPSAPTEVFKPRTVYCSMISKSNIQWYPWWSIQWNRFSVAFCPQRLGNLWHLWSVSWAMAAIEAGSKIVGLVGLSTSGRILFGHLQMACRLSIFAAMIYIGMISSWNFVKNSPAKGALLSKNKPILAILYTIYLCDIYVIIWSFPSSSKSFTSLCLLKSWGQDWYHHLGLGDHCQHRDWEFRWSAFKRWWHEIVGWLDLCHGLRYLVFNFISVWCVSCALILNFIRAVHIESPVLASACNDCQKSKQTRPCKDSFNAARMLREYSSLMLELQSCLC